MVLSLAEATDNGLLDVLRKKTEVLDLSPRTRNALELAGATCVWEAATRLKAKHVPALIRNIGRKSHNELREVLGELGITLGLEIDDDLRDALRAASDRPPFPASERHSDLVTEIESAMGVLEARREELIEERGQIEFVQGAVATGVLVVVQPATPSAIRRTIERYDETKSADVFDKRIEEIDRQLHVIVLAFKGTDSNPSAFTRVLAALKLLSS